MRQGKRCILLIGAALSLATTNFSYAAQAAASTQGPSSVENLPVNDVERFTSAIEDIKQYYVTNVTDDALFENAIKGMVAGLDPHSSYLDIDEYSDLKSHTTGKFGGLGIEITAEDGYVKIVSPVDDTPAAKAGLKSGDLIIKIDNAPVKDMDLTEAVSKLRGPQGTQVTLSIFRKSDNKLFNITLTRELIKVVSIKSKLIEPGYGYIRISQFQEPTMQELNASLKTLDKDNNNQPLKGLILDLRNDPGGLLDAAIDVSDAFLDSNKMKKDDLIVYTKGRAAGSEFQAHASPGDLLNGAPIVVLINEGSASASEIVAGALQDHKRAIIVGTNSFGKGSVQTVIPLDEKRALKLTTAFYYTPKGRSIQAQGIKPDIYVELMDVKKFSQQELLDTIMVKEADLENHFANQSNPNASPINKPATSEEPLAVTDFQLYQALNLLKAANVFNT